MNANDKLKAELRSQIVIKQVADATATARQLGSESGEVLAELANHQKSSVRLAVLDVAAEVPSAGASRAILSRLRDSNLNVAGTAHSLISCCTQQAVVPDLFEAMRQHSDPKIGATLALQIGVVGARQDINGLSRYGTSATDPQLAHDIGLALARLGDEGEREALIARLIDDDAQIRFQTLRDCEYVQDKTLAAHFGAVLEDERDVVNISHPNSAPEFVRVCDIAVQVLYNLDYKLSFDAGFPDRWTLEQLQEAKAIVARLAPPETEPSEQPAPEAKDDARQEP